MYLLNLSSDPYYDVDIFSCQDLECSCFISHKIQWEVDSSVIFIFPCIFSPSRTQNGGRGGERRVVRSQRDFILAGGARGRESHLVCYYLEMNKQLVHSLHDFIVLHILPCSSLQTGPNVYPWYCTLYLNYSDSYNTMIK